MKKTLSVLMLLLFALTACAAPDSGKSEDKLNVVTTIFPQYDLVREVGGDKVNVTMLLQPGVDAHSYEPSPADIINIQKADLFIYTGGESDDWVNKIKNSVETDGIFLSLMDKVDLICKDHEHEDEHAIEHEHDDEYDEHIWTSVSNAKVLTEVITNAMCAKDSENAGFYKSNSEAHLRALETLDGKLSDIVNNAKRKTLVFGDRFPFLYLAKEYGLSYHAAFPGCSSEAEPSAAKVAELIEFVKDEQIPYIFYVEMSNKKIAQTISNATGADMLLMHSCHNIAKEEFESGTTYIELMNKNADNLKKALN